MRLVKIEMGNIRTNISHTIRYYPLKWHIYIQTEAYIMNEYLDPIKHTILNYEKS
jgi:hypothetical protein